jgi:CheY-like chemotaxis protein
MSTAQAGMRILVVDDHAPFRETAADFLRGLPGIATVETARSGEEALARASSRGFDLVLLDLTMPGMNGIEAARALKRLPSAPRVYIASMQDSQEAQLVAREAGADAFISKTDFAQRLQHLLDSSRN